MNRSYIAVLFVWLCAVQQASASTSNIVLNGSFEQGTLHWTLFGQGNGTLYTQTNNATDGTNALRAANRTNLSYYATQNIHFSTNANNPAFGALAADPDSDRSPNLYEYATGTDPNQPSGSTLAPQDTGMWSVRSVFPAVGRPYA